jgi:hypothetical protein
MMRIALLSMAACAALAAQAVAASAPTVLHISSHLAKAAKVSLDGKPAVRAPGYGSTTVPVTVGHHVLNVVTAAGVSYQGKLDLRPETLMTWKGRGYWCVNLLERSVDVYSTENCEEDVTDAG